MGTRPKVLVVDDNAMNQEVIVEFLELEDYDIEQANDGQEALDLVKANNYDLILMDIMMPVMDGVTATRSIRELDDPQKSQVRIIAVTAKVARDNAHVWKQAGFNGYIIKPFDEDELRGDLHGCTHFISRRR